MSASYRMHRFAVPWAFVAFCALSTAASLASPTAAKHAESRRPAEAALAPADRYFGPTKMSIVGMHTAIVNLGERYHARSITDSDLVHDASIVEAALYLWHAAYPKDAGAITTAFALEQLDQAVQSTNAHSHATALLHFIAKAAPRSAQAHVSRLRLSQSFPPLAAETATHATPSPYTQEADRVQSSPAATDPSAPASSGAPSPTDAAPAPSDAPIAAPSATGAPNNATAHP